MLFTQNEAVIYNLMVDDMLIGGLVDVDELSEKTGLAVNSIKGVLGSLSKKRLIECEEGDNIRADAIWPIHRKNGEIGFWADMMSREEVLSSKILEEEIK